MRLFGSPLLFVAVLLIVCACGTSRRAQKTDASISLANRQTDNPEDVVVDAASNMVSNADVVDEQSSMDAGVPEVGIHQKKTAKKPRIRWNLEKSILVLGLDRSRRRFGGRADAMMLLLFDANRHLTLLSIPRDLSVSISEREEAVRINTLGRVAFKEKIDPYALYRRVFVDTFGVDIDHIAMIELDVIEDVIDALGGVDVEVACPIRDNFIDERSVNGRRLLDLDAGHQTMNGATATMYMRSRHGRSDWSRIRRQHRVLDGMIKKLGSLSFVVELPSLYATFQKRVKTDIDLRAATALLWRARAVRRGHLHSGHIRWFDVEKSRTLSGRSMLTLKTPPADILARARTKPIPSAKPPKKGCIDVDAALKRTKKVRRKSDE